MNVVVENEIEIIWFISSNQFFVLFLRVKGGSLAILFQNFVPLYNPFDLVLCNCGCRNKTERMSL